MAFGDEAQNTWDKLGSDTEMALNGEMDEQSNIETQEAMAAEADMSAADPAGFREHLGQEMPSDDSTAMATDDLPAEEGADAELDSDRDYDTDLEESSSDGFTDRDSF